MKCSLVLADRRTFTPLNSIARRQLEILIRSPTHSEEENVFLSAQGTISVHMKQRLTSIELLHRMERNRMFRPDATSGGI